MKLVDERPEDELTDRVNDALLRSVLNRQLAISAAAIALAELLYNARALWVGSEMPWDDLTPQQKHGYVREMEALITVAAPVSLPDATGDSRSFDGHDAQEEQ